MKPVIHDPGRRLFLERSAWLSAAPLAGSLLAAAVSAQTAGDYKALVCIDMNGGNDQSNTVVPRSAGGWAAYNAARPLVSLAMDELLPISPLAYSGEELGFNPALEDLKTLFDSGKLAVLANVGPLAYPLTLAELKAKSKPLPLQIGSHSDQQQGWHSGLPDAPSSTGWMGRMGDVMASVYNPNSQVSMAMSMAGTNRMQAGNSTVQYQLSNNGAIKVGGLGYFYGVAGGPEAVRQLMTGPRSHLLEKELVGVNGQSIAAEGAVRTALDAAGDLPSDTFPNTRLGRQLKMVARMIRVGGALSQRRQVFYVNQGGFDHHDNLVGVDGAINAHSHASQLLEIAQAMSAFNTALEAMNMSRNVTTFTMSEFGRTLQNNGRGSDHGWGGHHFIMGGAVVGKKVYGQFPTVALKGPEDAWQGSLMPTTSVDQYVCTLANWFGVSGTNMSTVLPNIGRFSNPNLGFLG